MDTGMAREGCPMPEWDALIARARREQRRGTIRVVGLMGHLPSADRARPESERSRGFTARMRQAAERSGGGIRCSAHPPGRHRGNTDATRPPTSEWSASGPDSSASIPSGTTDLAGASRLTAPIVHSATVEARHTGRLRRHVRHRPCTTPQRPARRLRRRNPARDLPGRLGGDPRTPLPGGRTRLDGPDRRRHRQRRTSRAAPPRPCSVHRTGSPRPSTTGPAGPGPFPTPSSPASDHE